MSIYAQRHADRAQQNNTTAPRPAFNVPQRTKEDPTFRPDDVAFLASLSSSYRGDSRGGCRFIVV
jgi:hypothetical protein